MKIVVIGAGYVGLVSGTCFAEMGHQVTCLDIDEKKISHLKKGKIPFYEPGLEELVKRNSQAKRLSFTTDYKEAIPNALVCFIAVPTPSKTDGSCDTQYIEKVADEISLHMTGYLVIVNKSTVPPGTARQIQKQIQKKLKERKSSLDFDVVSNPEFLKEGNAIADCMKPDRIVIGYESEKAKEIMQKIYTSFNVNHERILFMDLISAEISKYAANAMLATRISFMNELASLSKKWGGNIHSIRKAIGSDERIGHKFLYAGIGYGGSCFPKDIRALIALAKKEGIFPHLLEAVEKTNNQQKENFAQRIIDYFEKRGTLKGKTLAIWGLAFKPDTDDIREATSLIIIRALLKQGASLRLFDPIAMENAMTLFKSNEKIFFCEDEYEAAKGADGIVLVTEWKQFRLVNFSTLKKLVKHPVIFDGRNQYSPQETYSEGFDYIGIGMPELIHDEAKEILKELLEKEASLLQKR